MEKFKQEKPGVWENFGEHGQAAVEAGAQQPRAEELLDGDNWSIAPEPTIEKNAEERRPVDPMALSDTQHSVAETLLGGMDVTTVANEDTFFNKPAQPRMSPMELTPSEHAKADSILTSDTETNSKLVPKKSLTEIPTAIPLKETTLTSPVANSSVYDKVGSKFETITPPRTTITEKPKGFLRRLFGG